jgi:hypothetical protein
MSHTGDLYIICLLHFCRFLGWRGTSSTMQPSDWMVWNVQLESGSAHQQLMEQFVRTGPHTTHPNGLAYGMSLSLVGFATFLVGRVPWGPTSSNPNGLAMFQNGVVPYGASGRVPQGPTSSNPNGLTMFQNGMVPYGAHSVVHGRSDPLSSWTTSRINYTCEVSRFSITLQINWNTRSWGCYIFCPFWCCEWYIVLWVHLDFSLFFPTPFWNNTKLDITHWLYSTPSQKPILGY